MPSEDEDRETRRSEERRREELRRLLEEADRGPVMHQMSSRFLDDERWERLKEKTKNSDAKDAAKTSSPRAKADEEESDGE